MANSAADPKAAPLADELKDLALSLPTSAFPKNFFCALCNQLAFDSYKLICCAKSVCSSCQANLQFPTTCPSCDHSPLEADSCAINKSLRNTMRVWLQKQKKKEEAKAAAQAATPPVEATPAAPEVQPVSENIDKPVDSIEEPPKAEDSVAEEAAGSVGNAEEAVQRAGSASAQPNEVGNQCLSCCSRVSIFGSASQNISKSTEPAAADDSTEEPSNTPVVNGMSGTNSMMNNMQGQMGFGFPAQGGFNNGMGWNGMPNMMANGNWNGMNPMDFNSMNGMYGNFGGNMGMNDMSAMNMMQYGGGFGNGWNGMGGGYGNFSGPNQMGGYNQSGAYPEMMNQFPKNNFPNQNQNRFHANQGGAHAQRNNRNGSQGGFGPGFQGANTCPTSHGGPSENRDGQSPDGNANTATEAKAEGEQDKASTEPTEEGKENSESVAVSIEATNNGAGSGLDASQTAANSTDDTGESVKEPAQDDGLKPIQTVDTGGADMQDYDQSMMGNGMGMPYAAGMMNQFPAQHMNAPFDPSMNMNMNMNMGYNGNFGPRGGFNSGAYGAATVLTGQPTEPIGVGVKGAPTGPRAMREGRPNTGFSSRVNSGRYAQAPPPPPPKSIASTQEVAPISPQRRVRSKSPLRDESMRVKERSPTRSRSRSRARDEVRDEHRERSRSADRHSRRDDRARSLTPSEDDHDSRKDRKHHRSSRYDDREQEHDDRYRDERSSRGDRTRSASADSKYRSSRRDKDKHRSSRSHRERSREHRRRHRSRSPRNEDKYDDDDAYPNGEKDSDGNSRRRHRSRDKDRHRERSRDRSRDKERERDRKDRKERERDYDYDREKDRSRDKDKERRRRRDRDAEEDERDYEDDKYRSSRRSRKDRDRERRDDDRDRKERPSANDKEEDVVGQMMKKRVVSPPLNAPTGPSANGFSIKGRSKNAMAPPTQPPSGPRAFQPPKGPAADRNKDRSSDSRDHRRRSSVSSVSTPPTGPSSKEKETPQDHYAAERERNARERDSRDRVEKPPSKSLHSRISSTSSRPTLSTKRSRDDLDDEPSVPKGPKADVKPPTGPASHRDKRRKSGAIGDDNIANLFTAGLRKNAKARRGGVRTEGDVEREMMERERERR
ncbi:hypothetical protein COCMIDRAFT_34543 [Bipolaris oryzae ATCC 44560]|uniref:RING-type domain-containing protein n=1 Tax=Bipolaris oryzae ATCC 44560 TaxID=930090 RepID=W6ZW00_COCMI|nr:uncharacterized protein COCMIDRAFT_34543 [Bipolaris oryzae ATCC 44560]EUC47981.1 hypothetical protein COCMIDRAFT_34543 [Bipolaris oryzae ATCC 44560]